MNNNNLTIEYCIEQIVSKMQELRFSKGTIDSYRHSYNTFLKFCRKRNYVYFSEKFALEFLSEKYNLELKDLADPNSNTSKYKWRLRHLRTLGEYSRCQIFVFRFSRFHDPVENDGYWNELYDRFMDYLKNECDYRPSTIRSKELTIRSFISILLQLGIHGIDDINQKVINEIISTFIHVASKSVIHRIGALKQFFSFCYENNLSEQNIAGIIPNITVPHEAYLPASWSVEEAKQLLESIDRSNPTGKRDYAILLIACRLGLRGSDIATIQLSDFNWETSEIHLTQKKTSNTIILPLLNDIGWAVIDYIKNGRPRTDETALFVRSIPPYDGLANTTSIENIFTRRLHDAGLHIPRGKRCGIHSLRHTLGSVLLEKETPLPIISQILGHQSIKSTETYLRLNMKGLEECPINPDKVFDDEI